VFVVRNMANTYHDEKGYLRDSYGRLIHRQIAYQQIYCKNREKYSKPFGEYVVHHIDENKKNNDVSNLLIMFPEDHKKIHQIEKKFISEYPPGSKYEDHFKPIGFWYWHGIAGGIRIIIKRGITIFITFALLIIIISAKTPIERSFAVFCMICLLTVICYNWFRD
tara:strand:- start:45 stop:539 length:495 start_codon:yes stop_codon:yes gene_type:complete